MRRTLNILLFNLPAKLIIIVILGLVTVLAVDWPETVFTYPVENCSPLADDPTTMGCTN